MCYTAYYCISKFVLLRPVIGKMGCVATVGLMLVAIGPHIC